MYQNATGFALFDKVRIYSARTMSTKVNNVTPYMNIFLVIEKLFI
jgi:hypothetical protein